MPLFSKIKFKSLFQFLLFTSIGALILYFLWQNQSRAYLDECAIKGISATDCSLTKKLLTDYSQASIFWLIVISIIFMASNVLRAIRSRMMLHSLGHPEASLFNAIAGVMVGYLANLGIPRSGELARSGIVARYDHVPFEKIFGTIILERIMDVICLLVMIAIGFALRFDALWSYISAKSSISKSKVLLTLGIFIVLFLIIWYFYRKLSRANKEKLPPFLGKIQGMLKGFMEGLGVIKSLKNLPLFLFYSGSIWVLYYLMHYLAFFAYEPTSHLNPIDGLLVFDFGSLGIVFPSPGGMGSYHAMIVEALKILSVDPVSGFSFAMITFFTLTVFCNIIFGILSLLLLPVINYRKP